MSVSLKDYYLHALGLPIWLSKNAAQTTVKSEWGILEDAAKACQQCALHRSRKKVVFGTGTHQAHLMIIGEAPGYYEDQQGEPFVGAAGQLLNKMLVSIGYTREQVYIANVLKCRPPQNRDPSPEEVKQCTPFLEKQISLIQPKVILALGKVAAHHLLGIDLPMYQLRARALQYSAERIPLIVTYHPAYLLRNPKDKAKTYADLIQVKKLVENKKNAEVKP